MEAVKKNGGIPQEGLKLLACVTMLIDHVGAVMLPHVIMLRLIGRLAFPIYCFLLSQGIKHTQKPGRYLLRMGIGMVLSEIPYDLLFYGRLTSGAHSVMVTLFLGLCMGLLMQRLKFWPLKVLIVLPFAFLADILHTDYGAWGIVMMALFLLLEAKGWQLAALSAALLVLNWNMPSWQLQVGSLVLPLQAFAVVALVPVAFYSGRKVTRSRVIQWGFYLFYPIHLLILLLL